MNDVFGTCIMWENYREKPKKARKNWLNKYCLYLYSFDFSWCDIENLNE